MFRNTENLHVFAYFAVFFLILALFLKLLPVFYSKLVISYEMIFK